MEIISKDEATAKGIERLEALVPALTNHKPIFVSQLDELTVSFRSWAGKHIEFCINRSGEIMLSVDSAPLVY